MKVLLQCRKIKQKFALKTVLGEWAVIHSPSKK